jgi:hypothetical protein
MLPVDPLLRQPQRRHCRIRRHEARLLPPFVGLELHNFDRAIVAPTERHRQIDRLVRQTSPPRSPPHCARPKKVQELSPRFLAKVEQRNGLFRNQFNRRYLRKA